jgi:hypothetical protein
MKRILDYFCLAILVLGMSGIVAARTTPQTRPNPTTAPRAT